MDKPKQISQADARKTLIAMLGAARDAGWARFKGGISADGSVIIDAGMIDTETADDFLNNDLRMGS